MDVKKLLLLLLLIPVVAFPADPISGRRDSMRVIVYNWLPGPTTGTDLITNAIVNRGLDLGIDATSRLFPAVEKLDTVVVDSTTEGGTLNSDFLRIYKVHRMIGGSARIQLVPLSVDTTQPLSKDIGDYREKVDMETSPGYYYTYKGLLFTQPKVGKAAATPDSFLVSYYALAPGLASDSDTTTVLKEYRQAIIYWAIAFCHEVRHKFDLAEVFMNKFETYQAAPVKRKEVGKE